jgi:hypothetical protein
VTFLVLGCSKDLNENQTTRSDQCPFRDLGTNSAIQYIVDLPTKGEFNVDVNEFTQLSKDKDENKLDYLLYYAADALKELIKDPAFNQKVIEEARKSPNETANVLKIADAMAEVAPSPDQVLQSKRSEIQDKTGVEVNSLSDIDQNLTHTHSVSGINRKYDLAIFVPNLATLDPNKQPIFSPNISVDEGKYPELQDHVIAWIYDKEDNLQQITIGEEEAMKSTNPIFIIDNAALTNLSKDKQKRRDLLAGRLVQSRHFIHMNT